MNLLKRALIVFDSRVIKHLLFIFVFILRPIGGLKYIARIEKTTAAHALLIIVEMEQ